VVVRDPQMRRINMTKTYTKNDDIKFLVNFDKSFNNHNIHLVGGFQQITNYWENLNAYRENSEFIYDQISA